MSDVRVTCSLWNPHFSDAVSIFDIMGSTGNSAILRPSYGERQIKVTSSYSSSSTNLGEFPHVVEGPQSIELLQSENECLGRRRVHEIKMDEVVDPQ